MSEEEELFEVYGLPVTEVPTHRPRIRADHPPVVFFKYALGCSVSATVRASVVASWGNHGESTLQDPHCSMPGSHCRSEGFCCLHVYFTVHPGEHVRPVT